MLDEYGDIQWLVTLRGILEEIVGEFSIGVGDSSQLIHKQKEGSFLYR
ncbi:hypothetical protein [Coxiella-like endosymbiont]|nr:hypothetical protein [Coxiella-like endosymbiont]